MSGLEDRDWSLLEAAQDSLREHMEIARNLKNEITVLKFYKDNHTCLGCRGEAKKCLCGEYRQQLKENKPWRQNN